MNRFFLILLALSLLSCQFTDQDQSKNASKKDFKPSTSLVSAQLYLLPAELQEISGISFIDSNTVACIQDEEGIIYNYSLTEEKIIKTIPFAGKGDFEDLVLVNDDAYVISNDGRIFQINKFQSSKPHVKVFSTPLTEKNNVEGLAYDGANHRLLLASKDRGIDNDKDKEIYAFHLNTFRLNTTPVFSIKLEAIENYFKGDALEESSKKFLKALGNKNLNEVFRPSALTFHPKTGELYVLSSINNLIAVLGPGGTLKKIFELKGNEFIQPEGLAFSQNGNLFVSNEGQGKKGNIIRVVYEDKQ